MTIVWLKVIAFYQRFISPYKGFHCAHHVLHKGDTCSNAVKQLISDKGLLQSLPRIRLRFKECRRAYKTIQTHSAAGHKADIPCDIPCDISLGDCSGPSKTNPCDAASSCGNCAGSCPFDGPNFSRKTWRRIIYVSLVIALMASYWIYGRGVSSVDVRELSAQQQSLFSKITQRDQPKLRAKITVGDKTYLSDIAEYQRGEHELSLSFKKAPLSYHIDRLEILDARVNIGGERVVVSQVLETFVAPQKHGSGKRYEYHIKRHWHFW